jgi:hypothetical protein
MRPLGLVLIVLALAAGCADDDPSSDAGDSTTSVTASSASGDGETPASVTAPLGGPIPTFEVGSNAFAYGDDPGLDRLWDECAAGNGKACDDLYQAAPVDSEYETFGYTCGNRPNVIICTELDDDALTATTG